MSFFGAVRLLVVARPRRGAPAADDVPGEIAAGAWAAWAAWAAPMNASPDGSPRRAAFGDTCRTSVGREGRLVEIVEGERSWLVCQET